MKIDPEKIQWQFWQKSEGYDYENDYLSLFDYRIISDGVGGFRHSGYFRLFKRFKMSNGNLGINNTRPLRQLSLQKPYGDIAETDFKVLGLSLVVNQYAEALKVTQPS